jgi:hypothetical protein
MKMIAEYLEHSIHFEQLAAQEADDKIRARLLEQAHAYYNLAVKRAHQLNVELPLRRENSNTQSNDPEKLGGA